MASSSFDRPSSMYNLLFKANKKHIVKARDNSNNTKELKLNTKKKDIFIDVNVLYLVDESIRYFNKKILSKHNFDIVMLFFSKLCNIDSEFNIDWLRVYITNLLNILEVFHKKEQNLITELIKCVRSTFIFSNMIYPPKIANILNFLEIMNNFFVELTLIYDNPVIKYTSELSTNDVKKLYFQLKYSSWIYKNRFSIFVKKFKCFIENQFIYRHFGKKERFIIRYDMIYSTLYELFIIYFCGNNISRYNDFVLSRETFNFKLNEDILSTIRPNFSNHVYITTNLEENYLDRKQEIYDLFMKDFVDLLTLCANTYVDNDIGYNLNDYDINHNPDLNRLDVGNDLLIDQSIFDLIISEYQLYLKEVYCRSRIWFHHDACFDNIKSIKQNVI